MQTRTEKDYIGEVEIPINALWGIHTKRAMENFSISGRKVHPELNHAYGLGFLSSGPDTGISEIKLPQRQVGSSAVPGKINPVIPKMVMQISMKGFANDSAVTIAGYSGHLELNTFLPLIADSVIENLKILKNAIDIFSRDCISGIEANRKQCKLYLQQAKSTATILLLVFDYQEVKDIIRKAWEQGKSIKEVLMEEKLLTEEEYETLVSPENVTKLGY